LLLLLALPHPLSLSFLLRVHHRKIHRRFHRHRSGLSGHGRRVGRRRSTRETLSLSVDVQARSTTTWSTSRRRSTITVLSRLGLSLRKRISFCLAMSLGLSCSWSLYLLLLGSRLILVLMRVVSVPWRTGVGELRREGLSRLTVHVGRWSRCRYWKRRKAVIGEVRVETRILGKRVLVTCIHRHRHRHWNLVRGWCSGLRDANREIGRNVNRTRAE